MCELIYEVDHVFKNHFTNQIIELDSRIVQNAFFDAKGNSIDAQGYNNALKYLDFCVQSWT